MKYKKNIVVPIIKKSDTPSPKISNKIKCKNCRKYYDPDNNNKCRFHPGELKNDGLRTNNAYDKSVYNCCGAVIIGFQPVLKDVPGCVTSLSHIPI